MKKHILFAIFTSLALVLSGCGSNDKVDGAGSGNGSAKTALSTSISNAGNDFNISMNIEKKLSSDYLLMLKDFRLLSVGGCEVQSVNVPDPIKMSGGLGSTATVRFSGTFANACTPSDYKIEFQQITSKGNRTLSETITYDSADPAGGGGSSGGEIPVDGFFNATTPMQISQANHEYEIQVQVLEDGYAASGKEVKVKPFERKYGTISNPTASTEANGYVTFTYTSPKVFPTNGTSATITLTHDNNGTLVSQNIVLQFNSASGGGSQYSFVNPTTPINVTTPGETQEISVYVVDTATQVGVSGKEVNITTIANGYGSVHAATVTTDAAGKASFQYTAPLTLGGLSSTAATLSFVDNGVTVQQTVVINVNPTTGSANTIQVLPLDSNVSADAEAKPISIYVRNGAGRPAENIAVAVEFFDARFGTMNKYEETTDSNGHIEFIYIAPADIEPLDGQAFDFNISVKSDPSAAQTVHIGFHKSVVVSPVADIYIAPNDMTIVRAGEKRAIKVTTVDSRNYAVSADLKIENPAQNSKDYGAFDVANFTTDALGNYTVTYTAPANLIGLTERNISIVELSTNLEKTLTIHFQQPANTEKSYDLNLTVNDSIAVDSDGTLGIAIHETGKPNDYIAKADVVSVKATTKFPKMLLFDSNATEVSYAGENINSLALHAQHFSGVAVVIIEAVVFNGVRDVTLKQEFPIVITSGPISSMSMFHSRNSFDADKGVYRDYYTIHAVDKYGNPVQEGTALHPTLINGVKEQNTTGAIAEGVPSIFTDGNANFDTVVDNAGATSGDRLIILPSPGKTSKYYMGDWSIKSHTTTTLTLDEQYDDVAENGLSYVVGNESREVTVNGVSLTVTADISSPNDSFKTDALGNMEFVVSYDPALKGKIFYLAANGPSNTKRIGTALKSSFFYGGYQLRTLISEISLTQPGDSFMTGFYVLDSIGNTYGGQFNARINEFDGSKGGFSIDNTKKEFTYYAPSDPDEFSALIGTTYEFNLTISESDETFQTIKVHYTSGKDYTNYTISSADENFTISAPNQEYPLSLYVSDGTKAVQGESVSIDFLDPYDGSFQAYQATTDASGRAVFTYVAPSDLALLYANPVTIHAYLTNNRPTDVNVTALFVQDAATYTLSNENNITINYPSQSKEIAVQLTKNGVPQAGETVVAKSIPAAYGSITNASVTTGTDGYARFTYIAPATLTAGTQPLELVYTDSNGVEISATSTITIDPKPEYALINPTQATISYGSQKQDIKIQLTQKGVPVAGKQIKMLAFADGNGTIANEFTQTTDSSGYATYLYVAPNSIDDLNGSTIALTVQFDEGSVHLEENATLRFELAPPPPEPDKPIVKLDTAAITINENSQTVGNLIVKVYKNNTPYDKGEVIIKVPNEGLEGTDIGYFDKYRAAVNASGIAEFTYTGPGNVLNTIAALDENKTTFTFYHSEADSNDTELTVNFEPPADPIIYRNYYAEVLAAGSFHMYPEEQKTFTVALRATDTSGNDVALDDENITNIHICSENTLIAKIIDKDTNTTVECVDLNDTSSFNLQSFKLSGLVPVKVNIRFKDANGAEKDANKTVNVRVYSGPPTAISISYVSTGQDVNRSKYIETLAVSATDEYGNKVDTQPRVTLGAIVGYAVDGSEVSGRESNETKRLFYGRSDIENNIADGEISVAAGATKFTDTIQGDVFKYVNAEGNNTDKLVIFGERKNYEAMGKWDIEKDGDDTLKLLDDYYGIDRSGLYYAVGHNYYQDQCLQDGREWIGFTNSPSYQLDEEGTVLITYKYDYHLTGKDALIWVNLTGYQPDTNSTVRFGEVKKHTLRGAGLIAAPTGGYKLAKQSPPVLATFTIWHKNAPEHYRNAKFGYDVTSDSTCGATKVSSTNSYDARTCYNGGSGATTITFQLTSLQDKDCKFSITNILPLNEF